MKTAHLASFGMFSMILSTAMNSIRLRLRGFTACVLYIDTIRQMSVSQYLIYCELKNYDSNIS